MTLTAVLIAAHLRIVGVLMAGLVLLNIFVPRRFGWRDELAHVSLLNRQIFQAHTFFLIVTLALFRRCCPRRLRRWSSRRSWRGPSSPA